MTDDTPHRRESDSRLDRIERMMERMAERLEQLAVLAVQEQYHESRIGRVEERLDYLSQKDAVQTKQLNVGERILWAILTLALGAAGLSGQDVFSSVGRSEQHPSEE
jgi:hypothetical protein